MVEVYVAAGSNVDPETNLCRALQALESSFGPLSVSRVYRNPAVGFEGADFLNLVVRFSTERPAAAVRQRLQEIEAACDRSPDAPKWAPRTMDLDILLYGATVSDGPGLVLPRPDLIRRAYMLRPLVDIAPDLEHPTQRKTMRELWQAIGASGHPMAEVTIPRCDRRRPQESDR